MNIGKKIRELRIQREMKMTEVAKLIEVSVSTYRDWEYGRKIPANYILKIASALSTSVEDLTNESCLPGLKTSFLCQIINKQTYLWSYKLTIREYNV